MKNPPRPKRLTEEDRPDPESRRICRGDPPKLQVVKPGGTYHLVLGIVCFCPKQAASIDLK